MPHGGKTNSYLARSRFLRWVDLRRLGSALVNGELNWMINQSSRPVEEISVYSSRTPELRVANWTWSTDMVVTRSCSWFDWYKYMGHGSMTQRERGGGGGGIKEDGEDGEVDPSQEVYLVE